MIYDNYGRPLNSLRIQVNASCNFKCFFCHMEGTEENKEFLSPEEIEKVVEVAASNGVNRVKFTGGEPLLRKDLEDIIARTRKHINGDISLTTNGYFLAERAVSLKKAGLNRINISMHSLDDETFAFITKVDAISTVNKAIDAAIKAGLSPVKVNFVVLNGVNVEEVDNMIDFTASKGAILQLIEYETDRNGENDENYRKYHYDLRIIEDRIKPLSYKVEHNSLHNRSRYGLVVNGRKCEVEFVMPQRNPDFCKHCSRMRVTARGEFQTCLNARDSLFKFRGKLNIDDIYRNAATSRIPYWRDTDEYHH
ncbi:MAG: GTP 3',8-cyclase MoaA [Candidatus Thermoplasmatota archaeon]|nr:GTP 3',8-cyclase MoaA [Candidatus Thermoplasmatota archaeon]